MLRTICRLSDLPARQGHLVEASGEAIAEVVVRTFPVHLEGDEVQIEL